jgi:RHS repeat-associated protein
MIFSELKFVIIISDKYYYLKDHLGSVRVVVDTVGEIVSYSDYDAWGMILNGRSSNFGFADDKYKFTGKELDTETGYFHFGARAYDGRIGRWNVIDPLNSQRPGLSPYNYCQNNPIAFVDPSGMLDTKYVDEEGNPLAETNDGNDATVTVSNSQDFLDDFNNTSVLARDSEIKNSEWITKYGIQLTAEEGVQVSGWAIASLAMGVEVLNYKYGELTYRIFNKAGNLDPHIYINGWGGGPVQVAKIGKTLKFVSRTLGVISVGISMNSYINGNINEYELGSDLVMSGVGVLGGAYGAAASLGYEVGKLHPLKLIGIDATKWFK